MNGQPLFHTEEMTTNGAHARIFLAAINIRAIIKNEIFFSKHFNKYSVEICISIYI